MQTEEKLEKITITLGMHTQSSNDFPCETKQINILVSYFV